MSERPRREFQGRRKPTQRQARPTRPTVSQRQAPQRNLQRNVQQAQQRMKKIKSPFARDQTKTITTRADPRKKRKLGQVPLRDRKQTKISKQIKKQLLPKQKPKKKETRVQDDFTQGNLNQQDINKVFDFSSTRRFF